MGNFKLFCGSCCPLGNYLTRGWKTCQKIKKFSKFRKKSKKSLKVKIFHFKLKRKLSENKTKKKFNLKKLHLDLIFKFHQPQAHSKKKSSIPSHNQPCTRTSPNTSRRSALKKNRLAAEGKKFPRFFASAFCDFEIFFPLAVHPTAVYIFSN